MAYIGNGSDTITRQEYNFVATEGQTTFVADYTVGYVDVFWNGFKIDSSEYVANNGTNIIVNNALKAGDKFSVIAYNAFNIANTYSKMEAETYVANYVDGVALGVGQTWQDVTASRSAGVIYTNTTGKPIEVSIYAQANTNSVDLFVDNVGIGAVRYGTFETLSAIIPSGSRYKLTSAGTATIQIWTELR